MGEIRTYTGKLFDPLAPEVERIDIVDIAHALSMLCQGNGHMKHFYSVGQHSISKNPRPLITLAPIGRE